MRKSFYLVTFLILLLIGAANAQDRITWDPYVPMDKQIFPSQVLALASIQSEEDDEGFTAIGTRTEAVSYVNGVAVKKSDGERFDYMMESGRIGIYVRNAGANTRLKYSIQIDGFADLQSFEIKTQPGESRLALMCPALAWNFEALKKLTTPKTVNARFSLSVNAGPAETKNIVVRVRTMNDAVFAYSFTKFDKTQGWHDNGYIFGAYVNEDHPMIDKLLKEALDTRLVNSFTGYQTGKKVEVLKQVFAIWNILQKRGIKYSSITESSAYGKKEFSQYVRLFEDALSAAQANCVDGSVVFVSILRKIGIDANLVLIPGHCFVVFSDGVDSTLGLETTMIGNVDLKDVAADPELIKSFGSDAVNQVSLKTFLAAIDSGTKTYSDNFDNIRADRDPRYKRIDIGKARRQHWLPLSR